MSQKLGPEDLVNESLDEEMERKGTSPVPDWLNVKKQVRLSFNLPVISQTESLTGYVFPPLLLQLTFYASYHSNPVNIAIHMACIPMILW